MEAFSLLKYWRVSGGGGGGTLLDGGANVRTTTICTKKIATAVSPHTSETEDDDDDDDDGPFFDLEFTVPDEDDGEREERLKQDDDGSDGPEEDDGEKDDMEFDQSDGENEREFKFTLSSGSSGDRTDPNVSLSPSDDLFFKGRLVPIEPSSLVLNASEPNSKSQFPVSLLKSATNFRVLMLKFKKSKSNVAEKTERNESAAASPKPQQKQPPENQQQNQTQNKFFTVKLKVEEVPIMSLFTRDNSSKASNNKGKKQNSEDSASDEKRFSKDVMQKYLKMVKPLYIRVSKRYGEKLRFSGQLSLSGATKAAASPPSTAGPKSPPAKPAATKRELETAEVTEAPPPSNVKSQKQGNFPAGLRVVCKHLGKSRSGSSAVAAAPSKPTTSRRRDDSLLQQQDGIQSAILHCKRSFNASGESSILFRSVSDPLYEKSVSLSTDSLSEEAKVSRI